MSDKRVPSDLPTVRKSDLPTVSEPKRNPSEAPTVLARAARQPGLDCPEKVGPYRIVRPLGEGGMGEVFEAEQEQPLRRTVALKLIKPGLDSKEILARFESERQALARMNHASIARVYDAGVTEKGRPFFAMEFAPGVPFTGYCDRHRLTTRQRLELFAKVCDGVQHAHQKGILHRDLKPANVLVMEQDGKAVPKIIDFGLAKATAQRLTEETAHTQLGQVMGTPQYMSPEQVDVTSEDIDTRTDVYSLGVMLYEVLTGTLPMPSKELLQGGVAELIRKILEVEPPLPSTRIKTLDQPAEVSQRHGVDAKALGKQVRGDLDWIAMKALEKDRARRYGSPAELAADLRRHLAHEPVLAGPPGAKYKLGKFVQRNRTAVIAASLILLALVGGLVGTAWQAVRAQRAATQAKQAATEAQQAAAEEREARIESEFSAMRAKAINNFMDYAFAHFNPNVSIKTELTVGEMLEQAEEGIPRIFEGLPTAEAAVRHMLGQTLYAAGEYSKAAVQADRAMELLEAEISRQAEADSILDVYLLKTAFMLRASIGLVHGKLQSESMLANRARIYETGLKIARQRSPEFIESLQRVVTLGTAQAPSMDEWRAVLAEISQLHKQQGDAMDRRGERAVFSIVGEARLRLRYELHLDTVGTIVLMRQLSQDSPFKGERETAMLLWLQREEGGLSPEETLTLTEESYKRIIRNLPEDHWQTAINQVQMARALRGVGRYREAEEFALAGYTGLLTELGPETHYAQDAGDAVVSLYQEWNQPEKLKAFLAQAREDGVVPSLVAPDPDAGKESRVP